MVIAIELLLLLCKQEIWSSGYLTWFNFPQEWGWPHGAGAMAKPDCIITSDGKLSIKTESTLKTTQFSCKLGEKFEETTADGRKTQVNYNL